MERLRTGRRGTPRGEKSLYRSNHDGRLIPALPGPGAQDLVVELVHDLRSPLAAILVLSEELLHSGFGHASELQRRQLAMVYSAAMGMDVLTTDVMELATGGGQSLRGEPALRSVGEVIRWVVDLVAPTAAGTGVELRTSFPHEELRWGHRSPLGRILLNLATNALNFTREGYVEIVASPSGCGGVAFSVRDTGPGIPPAALKTLLQPLDLPQGPGEYPPRGLGLMMCRRLLRAMGSKLEVETRRGWGTRFHFELELPLRGSHPDRVN